MKLVVTGSEGNIGRRLMAAFPGAVGIDVRPGAAIIAELATADCLSGPLHEALAGADAVIHLASSADPDAPESIHWQAVVAAARLFAACAALDVARIVAASSDWAEPSGALAINSYGHSKRVIEALAAMYALAPGRDAVALRVGWVPADASALSGAPDWLARNYWDDARLVAEFRRAIGL